MEIKTVAELKAHLGMKPDGLLQSTNGELADILDVKDGRVLLGILSRRDPVWVPLSDFRSSDPRKSGN